MISAQNPKTHKIKNFFAIRQITGFSLSPDGKTVAYIVNTDGIPNIWTIPVKGGWTNQITIHEDAVKSLHYSPKKNEILYISDFQGDENLQLFTVSGNGGETNHISKVHNGFQVIFACWNKKGDKILYASNKRDRRFFDTYIYDTKSRNELPVFQSDDLFPFIPASWSKNERYIIFIKFYNNLNQDIYLFNRDTKTLINITEHKGIVKNLQPEFNKADDTIYFLSNYEKEFMSVAYYSIKSGNLGWLIEEKWDIETFSVSNSGKYLLYNINEDGSSKLKLKNLYKNKIRSMKIPAGNIYNPELTKDEKKIVYIYSSPGVPHDIFVYNIREQTAKQLTFSMIGGIPKSDFVIPKKIKYNSFDGLEIPAYIFIPEWMKKDGSNPAILWPHGGPEWQEKYQFNKYFQIFANRGYIVIAPNFRGSTGYGKTFQQLIYKDWGGNEFKDVMKAYEYLLNTGYVDKNRIAVVGGSFGGFMTLTCITKQPDKWKCAVDVFGPSNLFTFLNSIPEHWKPGVAELVGDTEKDKDFLTERSPINYVNKIICPLLIIQGKNDPRVVQQESDQIVEKLRMQNKEVEYIVIEDEGHGFTKVSNQIKVWESISSFLDKHMKS